MAPMSDLGLLARVRPPCCMWENCSVSVLAKPQGGFTVVHGELHGDVNVNALAPYVPEDVILRGMQGVLEQLHELEQPFIGYGLRVVGWGAEAWLAAWNAQT